MYDVVIAGAGPAGTAAAFDLLSKGLKVLILDKYEFPRKKACAGGITPKALCLFKYDISSVLKRECKRVRVTPLNQKPFLINDDKPLCHMTKREELDLFSLNKIIEKGAGFQVIKHIQSVKETQGSVEIDTGSNHFTASYLIGADGANSRVRRLVSQGRFYQKQFAIEADVKIDRPDRFLMEFDFSRSKQGYYWIFPRDDHVNIGIYSTDPDIKLHTRLLLEYAGERLLSRKLESVKGYPICTGGFNYRPDSNRILLVGDAAGLAENLLGEGIYFAVKSGQQVARAILDSELSPLSAKDLYMDKLKKIQSDLRIYDYSSKWFYRFPRVSLKTLSFPVIHKHFAKGFAAGKTIRQILYGHQVVKKCP